VGAASAEGTRRLVEFAREVAGSPDSVGLDWHGHDDRGLGLSNALSAIEAGVDRVHATALGVGERVGNTPLQRP
jgi:2-isopropylmalate synthase